MDYKDYSRREILDKAEYYRSIGKTSHQKKLEDYVKAMDYGTDGFGVPYKKCSDSELKKLMEADPEPEKLPTAAKSDKKGAIDVEVVSSAPSNALMIAETIRQKQIEQKEKKQPQLALPPAKTPLALPPARQLALPPAKEEPPKPTTVEPDEDWEGDPMDHRDLPWAMRGIDDLRDQIDKDPNIPFGDDKIPYEDDITQIMKDRDESIEQDEKEKDVIEPEVLLDGDPKADAVKELPTADGKKQRRKTKGKGKIELPDIAPKKGGAMVGGLKEIAKNISEARQALFDFYKVQKDRFKLRKNLDKRLDTKMDAQKDEAALEGDSANNEEGVKKDPNTGVPEIKQSDTEKGLLKTMWSSVATMFFPLLIRGFGVFFNDQADEIEKQQPEEFDAKEEEQLANDVEKDTNELKKQEEKVEGQETETETTNETQNTEETTVTNLESSETQDTNLESNTSTMETNVSNEQQSEQEEIPAFAEGGKITSTQAPSQGIKPSSVMSPPKTDSNIRQGLQQLSIKDLSTKGTKALNTFVKPIKSVFKLPNIVAKNTLKIGRKVLSPVGKLAGSVINKHPLAMLGKGVFNSIKGDNGQDGKMTLEKFKETEDYKEMSREEGFLEKQIKESSSVTSTINKTNIEKSPRLRQMTSSFGNNIISDIKDRGVTGIAGGIADHFTGNLFNFDGKNLKPNEMKNAMIDKGESVTTRMVAALQSAKSRQTQRIASKQNSGTGKKMQIPSAPISKSSKSSINKSLQPGL